MENREEELKTLKQKYKKMKLAIFLVIILVILGFVINLLYTSIVTQKIFKANYSVDIGNNYKITYFYNGEVNRITYCKDNRIKNTHLSGDTAMMFCEGKQYFVNFKDKEYLVIENNEIDLSNTKVDFIEYIMVEDEYINSLSKIIKMVLELNFKIKTEKDENQKEYLTLEMKDYAIKLWINKETNLVEKQVSNGSTQEIKIEKDVVKDEDLLSPEELGFSEVSIEDFK